MEGEVMSAFYQSALWEIEDLRAQLAAERRKREAAEARVEQNRVDAHNNADSVTELKAERDRLRALLVEAGEALEPFARAVDASDYEPEVRVHYDRAADLYPSILGELK
jgi:hypothetical protein